MERESGVRLCLAAGFCSLLQYGADALVGVGNAGHHSDGFIPLAGADVLFLPHHQPVHGFAAQRSAHAFQGMHGNARAFPVIGRDGFDKLDIACLLYTSDAADER